MPNLDEFMAEIMVDTKETVVELVEKVPKKELQRKSGEEKGKVVKKKKKWEKKEKGREEKKKRKNGAVEVMMRTSCPRRLLN